MKKIIYLQDKAIGDGHVTIQSMTNTRTSDVDATLSQIKALADAGADFVRISVPDRESASAVKYLTEKSPVPLIGDIHFSAEPAITAVKSGIAKIRVNPSNIPPDGLKKIVEVCKEYRVPIRVGVNKGSVKRKIEPKELVDLTLDAARQIEELWWDRLVLAVKTSSVKETVDSYRLLSGLTDYPLHVGLTESGTFESGSIKSAVAIGSLLLDGIGDTIRVSLAGDPIREVYAAKKILRAVGLDRDFVEVVACPSCARTEIPVEELAMKVENITKNYKKRLKIAVMGCVVNGVGEGKDADFGVAGGRDRSVLFKQGEIYKTVDNSEIERELIRFCEEYNG
ncbi:MAG: flavodoxin-dependent (E)-4-hydroxy-3-methylbut-2-enyl-diphosphate synthase [Clostridia bacterium]|nr:flavodoxin-dependent (E)-4-hydroxy-3-methylbut-2-enyl-diphosphate synthase [Clostridia bacterium]